MVLKTIYVYYQKPRSIFIASNSAPRGLCIYEPLREGDYLLGGVFSARFLRNLLYLIQSVNILPGGYKKSYGTRPKVTIIEMTY